MNRETGKRQPARHASLRIAGGFLALACLVALAIAFWPARAPKTSPEIGPIQPRSIVSQAANLSTTAAPRGSPQKAADAPILAGRTATARDTQSPPPAVHLQPTPETRQLVNSLVNLEPEGGVLTQEQAAAWKENLQQLIQHGPEAVPAIAEFLARNTEFDFGQGGLELFGYASVRVGLFDALTLIGGPEAVAALAGVLQTTADPREVALLAQDLEKLDPAQHRQEALDAARQTLAMAAEGRLPDRDVAPLFEVLQNFGDASVAADLKNAAGQWNYYAAVALAQLPDGAGISSLIEMAQSMTGPSLNALEMLAELSGQYPEANAALLEMARSNKISPNQWPYLTPLLAGDQYHYQGSVLDASMLAGTVRQMRSGHVLFGNQRFYTAPAPNGLTPERINQQTGLIDELLAATTEPGAVQALEQAKGLLAQRALEVVAIVQE